LDVAFQFRSQRAVIPETVDPAVDFRGLENKAAPLAEGDNLFHQLVHFRVGHRGMNLCERPPDVKKWTRPIQARDRQPSEFRFQTPLNRTSRWASGDCRPANSAPAAEPQRRGSS